MKVVRQDGYTRVVLGGQPSLGQLLSLLLVLEVDCRDWPPDAALVDLRGLQARMTPAEQQRLAAAAAAALRRVKRAALLAAPGRIRDANGLRAFEDEREAVAWLRA